MAEALDPILPGHIDALTQQLLNEACMRGLKLVTAESCTGGLLASLLTDVPGCSHAFERGFVTYTDEAKHQMLGVPTTLLETLGAVSGPVAVAMAEGALARSAGDVAVSVTGWAEAGPGPDQPAGLVHFAAARRNRPTAHSEERFGDIGRAKLRVACLEVGLRMMLGQIGG